MTKITEEAMDAMSDALKPKKSYDDLFKEIAPYVRLMGKTMKHKGNGNIYKINNIQFKESDMSIEFTYGQVNNMFIQFSRPIKELERFEIL